MSARRGLPANKRMRHDAHYVDNLVFRDGEVVGRMMAIEQISPNPEQPRKDMGDLESLSASIREQGVLEPLLVNKQDDGTYLIISGERRYHASQKAGLEIVPCIVKNLDKNQILEIALVENLQRKDLHPFEEADGLKTLLKQFHYTHEHIAKKIGKSRSSVTETLTLANLDPQVRDAAQEADITAKSMLLMVARQDGLAEQLAMIAKIAAGARRDEVRRQTRKQTHAKPFVFKFQHPKKTFALNLKFKKAEVERHELIEALEMIIDGLKAEAQTGD